tara:strand:+ start:66 stop:1610 length:1545 start_codon:yes stop_codon:yes gene_type:complete
LLSLIFLTIFKITLYYNFEPRSDQAHQIGWINKIINSKFLISQEAIKDLKNIINDYQGLIFELVKPTFFYGNLHANYFHLSSILIISIFAKFSEISEIYIFNILSIISSFLSFYLLFKILEKLYFEKIKKNYSFFFLVFFGLFVVNWYSFIFSPLGVHNISSMIILLNFYLYLNVRKINFFYIGLLYAISSLFHQVNFIILSLFYFFIIFEKINNSKQFIKNLTFFIIGPIFIFSPLVLIVIMNLDNYSNIVNDINDKNVGIIKVLLNNLIFFIGKNIEYFSFIFFFSILTFFCNDKEKFIKNLKLLFFLLILFSIFLNEFFVSSYHRISIYFFYIYVILSFRIIFDLLRYKIFKYFFVLIVIFNVIYNINLIFKNHYPQNSQSEFFSYFHNQGEIKKTFNEINQKFKLKNIVFLNNLSEDYYNIFNDEKEKFLKKPLNNFIVKNDKDFSKKIINKEINLFSFVQNDQLFENVTKELQENFVRECSLKDQIYSRNVFKINDTIYYKIRIDRILC